MRVDQKIVNMVMIVVVLISAPLYVFFAWLSDRIGRRPVMLFGMVVLVVFYFPGFQMMTRAANPALADATVHSPVTVTVDPDDCSFMLDLTGGAHQFATTCDIARGALADAGVSYTLVDAPAGTLARVELDNASIESVSAEGLPIAAAKAIRAKFAAALQPSLTAAGYPAKADPAQINFPMLIAVMVVFIVATTALYGPQAAALVELFPTRIRYTAFSFPYNVGTGWFGGLAPVTALAIVTATGNIYAGLWFPLIVTAIAAVIFMFFWPETKDRDIHAT